VPIPLPEVPSRLEEVKGKEGIVISCRTGMRARVAYSILKRQGIDSTILSEGSFFFIKASIISPHKASKLFLTKNDHS
jgi:rhodanese-related sulfurtransferase